MLCVICLVQAKYWLSYRTPESFDYNIMDFSRVDLNESYFKKLTDSLNSEWLFGLHGKHRFVEFQMMLVDGPSGM